MEKVYLAETDNPKCFKLMGNLIPNRKTSEALNILVSRLKPSTWKSVVAQVYEHQLGEIPTKQWEALYSTGLCSYYQQTDSTHILLIAADQESKWAVQPLIKWLCKHHPDKFAILPKRR